MLNYYEFEDKTIFTLKSTTFSSVDILALEAIHGKLVKVWSDKDSLI